MAKFLIVRHVTGSLGTDSVRYWTGGAWTKDRAKAQRYNDGRQLEAAQELADELRAEVVEEEDRP